MEGHHVEKKKGGGAGEQMETALIFSDASWTIWHKF